MIAHTLGENLMPKTITLDIEKAIDVLSREVRIHREAADDYSSNKPVWTARMAATHICSSLIVVLLEAQER